MVRIASALLVTAAVLGGCASGGDDGLARDYRSQPLHAADRSPDGPAPFAEIGYASWQEDEPDYRLYPGDVLDVALLSAPELNRTVTVQPDGRITLPLIPPTMVADRSAPEVQAALAAAYSTQLVRPDVALSVKQASPLRVFVGGHVEKPGVYDMPGDIDALQAVIMAGGFRHGARARQVAILRRGPDGQAMLRSADLRGASGGGFHADSVPLRRFDVIYVPKTTLAEIGGFVQQVRDALPVQFSYVIGGQYVTSR